MIASAAEGVSATSVSVSAGKGSTVSEPDAKAILDRIGIRSPRGRVARNAEDAAEIVSWLGVPAAVKIVSEDVSHKSAVGGVELGVDSPSEAKGAYARVIDATREAQPTANISGVLVEEMMGGGIECVLALTTSTAYGSVVMFGLGGAILEALGDVTFRLAPLAFDDALEMIREIRSARCFEGLPGVPAVDLVALANAVVAVGNLSRQVDPAGLVLEIEINPLLARSDGVYALDALAILAKVK